MSDDRTFGERATDAAVAAIGTLRFLGGMTVFLAVWIVGNKTGIFRFDPYPFLALNFCLSLQAAYASPLILLSGNRQAAKDRAKLEADYATNLKAESEISLEALELARLHMRFDQLEDNLLAARLIERPESHGELVGSVPRECPGEAPAHHLG